MADDSQAAVYSPSSVPHYRDDILSTVWNTPAHAASNFVAARTLSRRWNLEVDWLLKNWSHESQFESQLLLAQVN